MAPQKLLDQLRQHTSVDCDTLDLNIAKELGPFVDCTSNQAIAYLELVKPGHEKLINESIRAAKKINSTITWQALAVEICMVKLAARISQYITGRVHIQVNPAYAYDTAATVAAADRIVDHFSHEGIMKSKVCIKIPSTWEGLQACKELKTKCISTLATTLFTIDQAIVAAQMGATYIAPYVNELAVHFEPGFIDQFPGHDVCLEAQAYYRKHEYGTQVLPASLTTIEECVMLAGLDHITISPPLLQQLGSTLAVTEMKAADIETSWHGGDERVKEVEEKTFRMAMTRRNNGRGEIKQIKAINVFAGFQEKLEKLMEDFA